MTSTTGPQLTLSPAGVPVKIERTAEAIRISVPSGVHATLLESYASQGEGTYTSQAKLHVTLDATARLSHYKVVQEGPNAIHQSFMDVYGQRESSFQSSAFLFGGARIRNTIHVRMDGERAECSLNGLYLATGDQVMETHTLIDHVKPHGTSREFYKGILDERSQGVFDGLIVVQKEAQKTDSAQTNKNLLLSSKAKAHSNPELKIFANDVKCKHGSTIGQINAEQLFYLRSRGVSQADARKLLIYAFASEMIEPVADEALKEQLSQALLAKFKGSL